MFCRQQVTVLKDVGCNTNVLLNYFVRRLHYQLDLCEANIEISHSPKTAWLTHDSWLQTRQYM